MSYFFEKINNVEAYEKIASDTRGKNFITAFGVQPTEKPFVTAMLDGFVLYVSTDYVDAQRVVRTLATLGKKPQYLPSKDDVLLMKRSVSREKIALRNQVLASVLDGSCNALVVGVEALLQYFPQKSAFSAGIFDITVGKSYNTTALIKKFVSAGYVRTDAVSASGEVAMRGDTLDVFAPNGRYRVSFWGDEVEEIRLLADDNTSAKKITSFNVVPLFDVTPVANATIQSILQTVGRVKCSPNAKVRLGEIVNRLLLDSSDGFCDNEWLLPFAKTSTLAEYLPSNTVVVWDEPKLILQRSALVYKEHLQRATNLAEAGEVLPLHQKSLMGDEAFDGFGAFHQLSLQTLPYQSALITPEAVHNLKTGACSSYGSSEKQLATDIKNWKRTDYQVVLFTGKENSADVKQKLAQNGAYAVETDKFEKGRADALIIAEPLEKGFISHSNKLVVIGTRDLGRTLSAPSVHKNKKQAFLSVEKGDYVVHDFHGIGLCEGIEKIKTPTGEEKDYIVVMYKGGSHLYVPVDASNLLSRYSGGENPTLSKLGGEDFARVKEKVKSGIREMSINLLALYAQREKQRGFVYNVDEYLAEEFENGFPFKPTADQVKCQEEIFADLRSPKIMDRLLVGDVGYGKTEVAMRTAFQVVANGRQVAVLVPTTILAEQHYETFKKRMGDFDVRVACVNRFHSANEIKQTLKNVADGKIDVLIGTHRLLSKDVKFNRLGLLILDEEQRFGVEHKEKIKAVKTSVDVLTLSATPIPRTLHMALTGMRDISTITTPPLERLPVETSVAEESDVLVRDIVDRELARGGQVFLVYNKVQTIDGFATHLREILPNARIAVAHGQMPENLLEDTVSAFQKGNYDVLVCSTIIENGIDMPNANTLVVYDADELGLSQLYQLRGRVGRSDRLAYAYFLYRQNKILSDVAYKRLSSVTEYSELGSGFKIAMKDLEIRGAGNVLGREQHGHMVKVGYDMYARLLKDAVAELKGMEVKQKINVELEIDATAYAPESYIPSQKERIDFYQQLAMCETRDELFAVKKQASEVYGVLPREVENLVALAELKLIAQKAGASKVIAKVGRGTVVFATKAELMRKEVFDALVAFGTKATVSPSSYEVVFEGSDYMQKSRLVADMRDFLVKIVQNCGN